MEDWKRLKVIGPRCEINRSGRIRQKAGIIKGRELHNFTRRPSRDSNGYLYIGFREGDRQENKRIHILVAQNYLPNPQNAPFVLFKDGDRSNVHANNLEWATAKKLAKRKRSCKLMDEDVGTIRALLDRGVPQVKIAKRYGVSRSLISHIKAGRKR